MHRHAYASQCAAEDHRSQHGLHTKAGLTLFALAFGAFAIGSGEFGSNGIIQLFSEDLGVGVPTGTNAITAYAVGVIVGSPLVTVAAAHANRRTLLLLLLANFIVGNVLSAVSGDILMLMVSRFITGMTQGAYFGAAAVVATYVLGRGKSGKAFALVMGGLTVAAIVGSPAATVIGQQLGWRTTYVVVSVAGALACLATAVWIPRTEDLRGGPIKQELGALRRPAVWLMMAVAALGISSIFAVYTFVGPFVTDAANLRSGVTPIALVVFGVGMTVGNFLGGRLADTHEARGLIVGFASVLVVLVAIGVGGRQVLILFPALFAVGATMMLAVPTVQVRLTSVAPEAPTLMGAMNLAALNLANSLGAFGGAVTINAGLGTLSTVWAGFVLTLVGLLLFAVLSRRGVLAAPASTDSSRRSTREASGRGQQAGGVHAMRPTSPAPQDAER